MGGMGMSMSMGVRSIMPIPVHVMNGNSLLSSSSCCGFSSNNKQSDMAGNMAASATGTSKLMEKAKEKVSSILPHQVAEAVASGHPPAFEMKGSGGAASVAAAQALRLRGPPVAGSNFGQVFPDITSVTRAHQCHSHYCHVLTHTPLLLMM
jgi:hypothetical protein